MITRYFYSLQQIKYTEGDLNRENTSRFACGRVLSRAGEALPEVPEGAQNEAGEIGEGA